MISDEQIHEKHENTQKTRKIHKKHQKSRKKKPLRAYSERIDDFWYDFDMIWCSFRVQNDQRIEPERLK